MVRKKVRTGFLLFKKILMVRKRVRTGSLLFKKAHGKEKGKNWILTFQKNKILRVRKKVRTQILLFQTITW